MERRNFRLSQSVKTQAAELLRSGLRTEVILDKYMCPTEENETSKPMTQADIHNVRRASNIQGYDNKCTEVENLTAVMTDKDFCGLNYGNRFNMDVLPDAVRKKVVDTKGLFLICYATPEMKKRFAENATTIAIDGTHKTCSAGYHLVTVLAFDSRGEGTPVFQCLMESESKALFSCALKVLQSVSPEACSNVKCILSDTSRTFINAWRETINPNVVWSVCHWHLEKNWAKHIKNTEMYQEIKNLRYITSEEEFMIKLESIREK